MNKFIKNFALVGITIPLQAGLTTSHTFFSVQPNFQSASPERESLFRNDLLLQPCCNGIGGAFQAVIYGGRTTRVDGSDKLVRFFLPPTCNGCNLGVKEYNIGFENSLGQEGQPNVGASSDYDNSKNIEARNLNIATINGTSSNSTNYNRGSFSSVACFSAQQSKFGIGFAYKQKLSCKCDGSTGFWGEVSLPIERVTNTIRIKETIQNTGGGALPDRTVTLDRASGTITYFQTGLDNSPHVDSVKAAFRQNNWLYGKIDTKFPPQGKWNVADMEVKVGYNTFTTECAFFTGYFGFIAPTGTRVTAEYVFEPIVGNNRHWGIMYGSQIAFNFHRSCNWDVIWWIDHNARYLLDNHQLRSFDLIGKNWSRYLEVYETSEQAAQADFRDDPFAGTSGINKFTTCVRVKPGFQGRWNSAAQFKYYGDCLTWQAEFGYNLLAKQAERLELDCCNVLENVAIKDIRGDGYTTTARTIKSNYSNANATPAINTGVPFSVKYLKLTDCDIDLESASHPAVVCHTAYATVGLKKEGNCPCIVGLGASYEFQPKDINTTLDRWLVWTKVGVTF